MVTAVRLTAPSHRLLEPTSAEWASAIEEPVTLEPTPIGSQPSEYVIKAFESRPYGRSGPLHVSAAHNGESIFFRLRWPDETKDDRIPDTNRFPDAAAVLFPMKGDAPLPAMGSPEQPVNAWYWRADMEEPLNVTASGLGTTVRNGSDSLSAAATYADGQWTVVISRPIVVRGVFALRPGFTTKVGFAVWQGANQERAGIKAVTLNWQPLEIEA